MEYGSLPIPARIRDYDEREALELVCTKYLGQELTDLPVKMRAHVIFEVARYGSQSLRIDMVGRVQKKNVSLSASFPADWWQAFKERWLRGKIWHWFLRRRPIKYTEVANSIDVWGIFDKNITPDKDRAYYSRMKCGLCERPLESEEQLKKVLENRHEIYASSFCFVKD